MRGPRVVKGVISCASPVVAGAGDGVGLAGTTGDFFCGTESEARREGRRFADGLCERFSFKTTRQNFIIPDGDALMPF